MTQNNTQNNSDDSDAISAESHLRGKLITIEGVDGAGKTTQRQKLTNQLRQSGKSVVETFEPDGSAGGRAIRRVLFEPWNDTCSDTSTNPAAQQTQSALTGTSALTPTEQLLLFYAARYEHIRSVIAPALAAGKWVVCDRYVDSSRIYQGQGVDTNSDSELSKLFTLLERGVVERQAWPDLTLVLLTSPKKSVERISSRRQSAIFTNTNADADQSCLSQETNATGSISTVSASEAHQHKLSEIETNDLSTLQVINDGFARLCGNEPKRCIRIDADPDANKVSTAIWQTIEKHLMQPHEHQSSHKT